MLEAADRKPIQLIVGIPVDIRMSVIQVASPSIITTLQRRPDVRVVAQIVVTAIGVAIAGGQSPAAKIIT